MLCKYILHDFIMKLDWFTGLDLQYVLSGIINISFTSFSFRKPNKLAMVLIIRNMYVNFLIYVIYGVCILCANAEILSYNIVSICKLFYEFLWENKSTNVPDSIFHNNTIQSLIKSYLLFPLWNWNLGLKGSCMYVLELLLDRWAA